ncbi:MAG: flagellar hook-length control protein FliK [Methylophilaceae bacterium]|nr:flagellar hook-length control protein FliK [Methylophilaceae bacterium]
MLAQQVAMSLFSDDATHAATMSQSVAIDDQAIAVDTDPTQLMGGNAVLLLPLHTGLFPAPQNLHDGSLASSYALPSAELQSPVGGKELPLRSTREAKFAVVEEAQHHPRFESSGMTPNASSGQGSLVSEAGTQGMVQGFSAASSISAPSVTGSVVVSHELKIVPLVGSESWGTGLGDKVIWVLNNQVRGAEIHLNPPALGPLEVRIQVTEGQANLAFMTPHPTVRDAIEAAAPRLREMLGDVGISIGNVSVGLGSFTQQPPSQHSASDDGSGWSLASTTSLVEYGSVNDTVTPHQRPLMRGLVDLFA